MRRQPSVLVTGASGFIGKRLVPSLRSNGHDTRGSVARLDRARPRLERADVVVHLAGRAHVPDSWQDPLSFHETNVLGTARVLDHCARTGARMVFISSYVYGVPAKLPISESAARHAANPYMHTKILAEDCCSFYASHLGVEVLIVRPFNVYGPGQDRRYLIPTLVRQLVDPDCPAVQIADPEPRRDFIYIDDLISLLTLAVSSGATGIVNAGSGRSHSIGEVYRILVDITGIDKPLQTRDERRRGEIMDVVADISGAERLLGWTPTTSLRDGLSAIIEEASQT